MNQSLEPVFSSPYFIALMIAVILLPTGYCLYANHTEKAWRRFAAQRGLSYSPGRPALSQLIRLILQFLLPARWTFLVDDVMGTTSLNGSIDNAEVDVTHHYKGTFQAGSYYTHIRVGVPGVPEGLLVSREDLLSQIGKALGDKDYELQDPEFDAAFCVYAKQASDTAYLSAGRRQVLMGMRELDGVYFDSAGFHFECSGKIGDEAGLAARLDPMLAMARALRASQGDSSHYPQEWARGEASMSFEAHGDLPDPSPAR